MKDERIEQAKNKIRSEIALIIFVGAILSFLVKTLIFNMDMQEYIMEYGIMIFFPVYQFIRMNMMKISIYSNTGNENSVKSVVMTVIVLIAASALLIYNWVTKSLGSGWQSALSGILPFLVLFLGVFFITNKYNKYRTHKYEKEFDDYK